MDHIKRTLSATLMVGLAVFSVFFGGVSAQPADVLEYTLGPGDVVKVQVYEQPDLTSSVPVSQRGTIRFWLLGDVKVGGMTVSAAEKTIGSLLEKGGYIKRPQVSVMVEQYRSQQVAVLGWVNKPGKYPIEGVASVIDVLAQAGGLRQDGGDRITVIRTQDGATRSIAVDIGLIYLGDLSQSIELQANDLVVVPRMDMFYVYGEVRGPNAYRLERDMTVMQALSVAGGLTPRGTERGVRVTRRAPSGQVQEVGVSLNDTLKPNDVVYVKESLF